MKMLDQIDERNANLTDWEKHVIERKPPNEHCTAEDLRIAIDSEHEKGRAASKRGDDLAAREHHGRAAYYAQALRRRNENR